MSKAKPIHRAVRWVSGAVSPFSEAPGRPGTDAPPQPSDTRGETTHAV